MEYQFYSFDSKAEVEALLLSNNREDVIKGIIGMLTGIKDWQWVQNKLFEFIHSEDFWVAKNAIVGFSDLARIYRELDKDKVINELKKINKVELEGVVESTIDDINLFV